MANDSKKYISLTRLSDFLDNIKAKYSQIGHKHTIADVSDYKVDDALSSSSANPVQNKVIDAEFEAVSTAMNALDLAIDSKADVSHNHDNSYDAKGSASSALASAKYYTDTKFESIPSVDTYTKSEIDAALDEVDEAIAGKANSSHTHNDLYYTEAEIDSKLSSKADSTHNHDSAYDSKGSASAVQANLNTVSDTLDSHTEDSDIHVTTANKSNWNSAYTHSTSTHARTDATKVADSTTNGNILINGTETNVYSHPNSGVTAGTYKSVTVNAQGHITGGTNPTTLAGYGITDAETKGSASSALASAKEYTDTVASGKSDVGHNHDSAYDSKGSASSALASAKTYADSAATTAANKVKNDLLNGAGTAFDTLKELGDLIVDNQDAIDALETVASGKANAVHTHAISDVSGLQSALDGKAASSHGTHVSYSTTDPVMDGTASVGSASTVARSDHKHPTDTSRASKTEFDTHTSNTTVHITSTERSNWNAAKTHADSAHAPSNAEKNQNAFSNITVGSTTVAADSATDTVTFVGSNVTITPDATNDKITFSVADGSTSAKGLVQLTNSTSSTSTTTAATPSSVKSAYDRAGTAITNAATAQARADSAYSLAEGKVDSLSDLGITATAAELNYVDGVTSNIQTQLDGKAASGHNHSASNITSGTINTARLPAASGTSAGITIVYPAASCTTFSSDSGTVTPLAVQKGAKMFAITRPSTTTEKAIVRYNNTNGDVQNSKIIIEDVTNTKDTSKTANVIAIPAEGNKKMVYGYCTDQVDGTSFIGGVFDASATEYPYNQGLAIGGTSGNLLWKGTKVATVSDIPSVGNGTVTIKQNGTSKGSFTLNQSGNATIELTDTNTTYSAATTSAAGLMSAADKEKLNGITESADSVSFAQTTTSGNAIGTITINGTDTKLYSPTVGIKAGASSTTSNSAVEDPYIKVKDTNGFREQIRLVGDGATTIESNSSGTITISSTDTDTKVKQMKSTTNGNFPLLLAPTDVADTDYRYSYYASGIYANPSLNKIYADINGTATGLKDMTTTIAELNYVDGVTSNIQTQLNGKQATISGGASTIASSNLTASRALVSNSSGKVAVSAVTSTELGYLDGVTSNVQTQLNNKAASSHEHKNGKVTPVYIELTPAANAGHGGYIDFHYNGNTADYTSRIIEYEQGYVSLNGHRIITAENLQGIYGQPVTFSNGQATFTHSFIKSTSIVIVQIMADAAGMYYGFNTASQNGSVKIYTDTNINFTINLNIIIMNP